VNAIPQFQVKIRIREWYMRGFEQMFMDMMLNPELVHEIMTRVTNLNADVVDATES